jgi:hypothetical protein
MEVKTLGARRGIFTSSQLLRAVHIIDEPIREPDDEDRGELIEDDKDLAGDRGILNDVDENLSDRIFKEISFREQALGDSYPFRIQVSGQNWHLIARKPPVSPGLTLAHNFYIASLLISAIKYEYIDVPKNDRIRVFMPELMQIMAVVTAAEYVSGEAYWMGWPRPNATPKFLSAVEQLIQRAMIGRVASANDAYDPASVKDGSVDLVAWRSFSDRKAGKLVMYGQVASGKNWRGKSLRSTYDPHFNNWFVNGPTREKVFSMFIPFMQHEDCKPRKKQVYDNVLSANSVKDERAFGIIFDRLRITEMAGNAHARMVQMASSDGIDFVAYFGQLVAWQLDVLELEGAQASAA